MVCSSSLCHETLVAFNDGDFGVFVLPLADVAERFAANGGLLSGLGRCPAVSPVVGELFEEGSLDRGGLYTVKDDALSVSGARNRSE